MSLKSSTGWCCLEEVEGRAATRTRSRRDSPPADRGDSSRRAPPKVGAEVRLDSQPQSCGRCYFKSVGYLTATRRCVSPRRTPGPRSIPATCSSEQGGG